MKLKFKQAVIIGKTTFPRGIHDVTDPAVLNHKYLHKLVQANLVEEAPNAPIEAPANLFERQKMLAEKLAKKRVPSQPPVEPEVMPPVSSGPPKLAASEVSTDGLASDVAEDNSPSEPPAGSDEVVEDPKSKKAAKRGK